MKIDKVTELYALVFNSLIGVVGVSEEERKMLVNRRSVILDKIKEIIVSDYQRTGGGKLTTRLLPTELVSSEVEKAISEAYYE